MGCDETLLTESLPWARYFARNCASKFPHHLNLDDLQSAGVLGYLRAASRYDSKRGASFRSFCAVRIRGAILDELRKWDWTPRSVHKTNRNITRVTNKLTLHLKRDPTQTEVAEAMGLEGDPLTAYEMQAQPRHMVSLDEIMEAKGEESFALTERLADTQTLRPDEAMISTERRLMLIEALSVLPKSQLTVIVLYYLQNIPLCEVARLLNVSPSRVSQLHRQALTGLREAWDQSPDTNR
jgi:RNA polymerase sigma factor for flagellar operon FliA